MGSWADVWRVRLALTLGRPAHSPQVHPPRAKSAPIVTALGARDQATGRVSLVPVNKAQRLRDLRPRLALVVGCVVAPLPTSTTSRKVVGVVEVRFDRLFNGLGALGLRRRAWRDAIDPSIASQEGGKHEDDGGYLLDAWRLIAREKDTAAVMWRVALPVRCLARCGITRSLVQRRRRRRRRRRWGRR